HIVFASSTYNNGIFCNMETALLDLKAHNLQNRTVAIIQNGTWSPASGKLIKEILESMKSITIIENTVTIKSSVKDTQLSEIIALADAVTDSINN
ncbi:MAG: FprA family A-type flavoprotein, partial [Oscillospiraceae bacterium]